MPDIQDLVAAEVDRQLRRRLSAMQIPILTQQNGTPVSGGHRTLNFQGAGVTVTDDSVNRRTTVFVPGLPAGSSSTSIVSSVGNEQVFDNGTSATGPTGWMNSGFSPGAGWTPSVADSHSGMPTPPSGASYVTKSTSAYATDERLLYIRTFSLPSGSITGASLSFAIDDWCEAAWINGNSLAVNTAQQGGSQAVGIPTAFLVVGAVNTLAIQEKNSAAGAPTASWMRLAYQVSVTLGQTLGLPYANIQDQKTQNTQSGGFTSGAWRTRTLTTIVTDAGGISSLSGNQVTLAAGTYRVSISCPAYLVARHQARLQNVTDGTTLLIGTSAYCGTSGGDVQNRSLIAGKFTLSASKALEVQHQCQTTNATRGFGVEANFGTEVYTMAEFWKES